ncbi:HU family DNA-binding protein [Tessaracoccus sp.]
MKKSELIDKLALRLGDHQVAAAAVDNITDLIYRSIARGEPVTIAGFGTFSMVVRAPRMARNPRTGAPVKVRKSASAKFKPGQRLRAVVKGELKLGREPKPAPMLPSGVLAVLRSPAVREVVAARDGDGAARKVAAPVAVKKVTARKVAAPVAVKKVAARKVAAPVAVKKVTAAAKRQTAKSAQPAGMRLALQTSTATPAPATPVKSASSAKTPVAPPRATRTRVRKVAASATPAKADVKAVKSVKAAATVKVTPAPVSRVRARKVAASAAPAIAVPPAPVKAAARVTRAYNRKVVSTKATDVKATATATSKTVKAAPSKPRKVAESNPAKGTVNKMRTPKVTVIKTATKAPAKRAVRKVAAAAK